jgi:hypothetical protein
MLEVEPDRVAPSKLDTGETSPASGDQKMKMLLSSNCTDSRAAQIRSVAATARGIALQLAAAGLLAALCAAPVLARTPVLSEQNFTDDESNSLFTILFAGTDSNLYALTYPFGTGMWSQMTGIKSRPAIAAGSGVVSSTNDHYGQAEEFYLTTTSTGATHVEQLYTGLNTPYDLSVLSSTPASALPAPTSTLYAFDNDCAGTDNVAYVGTDQHIHVLTWSAGHPWKEQDLTSMGGGGQVEGNVIGGHETPASNEIFYAESNGHIVALWSWLGCSGFPAFNGWHNSEITGNAPGAALAINGGAFSLLYDFPLSRDALFYIDRSHNVQLLVRTWGYPTNGPWQATNLTAAAGSPPAASGSALANRTQGFGDNVSGEVIAYFDATGNIWEILSVPEFDTPWVAEEPSAGFPAAVAGSPLLTDINLNACPNDCEFGDLATEYYYITPDKHVRKLSMIPNQSTVWNLIDITATTGAPVAAP